MDCTGSASIHLGPHLPRLGRQKVLVTRPGTDNIGEILTSMGVEFERFELDFGQLCAFWDGFTHY